MIEIHKLRWSDRDLNTRIPFKYGIATMVDVTHVWLELEATIDGERVLGQSADHLPPKWFTKDPNRPLEDEVEEMRDVLDFAGATAVGVRRETVHAVMQHVAQAQEEWAKGEGLPTLLSHFGVTFVERALIDAFCRRHDAPVGAVLRSNGLGVVLSDLHPELADWEPKQGLPEATLGRVASRHTVGLGDPLEEADVIEEERPADDLPVSLRAVCRHYQSHDFKIKVAGDPDAALDRLERVVRLIDEETSTEFSASIDGNESFANMEDFRDFWTKARARPGLADFWSRLMFVEQPIHRDHALAEDIAESLQEWPEQPPLLIDESGGSESDLRQALKLGYIGVSHKNCKGVIQGVANRCLLTKRMRENPELALQMSAEDLSNIGPIALPQDLAVQAALGNASVERNGHHYFAGLSEWPESIWPQVATKYPDLYRTDVTGCPFVHVDSGQIDLTQVNARAFGGELLDMKTAGQLWLVQGD